MFKRFLTLFTAVIPLLISLGCGMVDSYKLFAIEGISGTDTQSLLTSNELPYACIGECIIVPEIKEINHGQYAIYLEAISKTQGKNVIIKSITFIENGNHFYIEVNGVLNLTKSAEDIYSGVINAGVITSEDLTIEDGEEVKMIVDAETIGDGAERMSKELLYTMTIVGYRSFLTIT